MLQTEPMHDKLQAKSCRKTAIVVCRQLRSDLLTVISRFADGRQQTC